MSRDLAQTPHRGPRSRFPSPERADAAGFIAAGGRLTPEWMLDAYRHGIFPWPDSAGRLAWWSPDPRAVFEFERFHVSRRLARTRRSGRFRVTFNEQFAAVVSGCASGPERAGQTWISPALAAAYLRLHRLGHAQSVEAWEGETLAGGVFGVAVAGLFAAESMFYRRRDASKLALWHLLERLHSRGFALVDIQQLTPHTQRLGAVAISRREYLARLADALTREVSFRET